MTANNSAKERMEQLAGAGGVLGGPALALAYIAHPASAPPETVASTFWIWVHVGFMVSLVAGVFLLTALMARFAAAGGGIAGFVGYFLATVSLIFVFGLDYAEVFIFPVLAVSHPDVVVQYGDGTSMPSIAFAFPLTGAAFLVGFLLFTRELRKHRVVTNGAAWLTMLGTVVFAAGLSGMFPMLVVKAGATIFGAGLVWLGLILQRPAS